MRFLIALVVLLGLSMQVLGQLTSSGIPDSLSQTWTASNTWTQTATLSGTPSQTYPQPIAPTGLANKCSGHIITICPQWDVSTTFNLYRLYYKVQGSLVETRVTTSRNDLDITGLPANTLFDFWVQGVDVAVGVWSANSSFVTMFTDAADPKNDPTLDISGFTCTQGVNPNAGKNLGRVSATCTWTAALATVRQINFKVHCFSDDLEPTTIKRRVYGTSAASDTSAFFAINRDSGSCTIWARFYYARRPTARHSFILNIV